MEPSDQTRQAIVDAIYAGRKIEAIKLHREATGQGLKESKDFIEALTAQLREEDPEKVPPPKSGCGAAALLLSTLAVAAWRLLA